MIRRWLFRLEMAVLALAMALPWAITAWGWLR